MGNSVSHQKLFDQLKSIGAVHKLYLNNYNDEDDESDIFELTLNSFNYCMEQHFDTKYTVRVRFCFNQLYRLIVDIMNDNDLKSLLDTNSNSLDISQQTALFKQVDGFLSSLADCLSDEYGSLYFKKYLEEHFCVENFLFYKAVQKI